MSKHVEEDLAEWNLGTLDPARRAEVDAHLRECAHCRASAKELQLAIDVLSFGPVHTQGMWAQVQKSLQAGKGFEHFTQQLAQLFDLPTPEVTRVLEQMSGAEGWTAGPSPGVEIFPVNAGPKLGDALTAFLRLAPGAEFPMHEHVGREEVLVLQGGYQCSTGVEFWRGELDVREEGTSHSFVALKRLPCVAAAVLHTSRVNS